MGVILGERAKLVRIAETDVRNAVDVLKFGPGGAGGTGDKFGGRGFSVMHESDLALEKGRRKAERRDRRRGIVPESSAAASAEGVRALPYVAPTSLGWRRCGYACCCVPLQRRALLPPLCWV